MTTYFGAIADDLTGATDLASLLARSGVPVSLRMGLPKHAPDGDSSFVEIIALKCRTAPVAEAVAETRAALSWLREAGAQRFFWKYCSTFDSTPDGNIGPVSEALMADLGAPQTIYCPAFPENGRSIFMGNLFVGEQPLAESPMKDHPLTPMRDSNLVRLLTPQVSAKVGLVNRLVVAQGSHDISQCLQELADAGIAHVVVDAVANEDLTTIAAACQDMVLMTGGSAIAMPLPDIWKSRGLVTADESKAAQAPEEGQALVLSGSCSDMTNRQVAEFLRHGGPSFQVDPLELSENGYGQILDWLKTQSSDTTPLIYATAAPEKVRAAQDVLGRDRAGELVEDALAAAAVAARDLGYRRFVVAGGETSGAVGKALALDRMDIGNEIAPGVPWCFATSAGQRIAITLKSGNFGAETFFDDALKAGRA